MTVTEVGPRPSVGDHPSTVLGEVAPRPMRGRLARRLPYALIVLALALGYAVGHDTNNPVPRVTAQPNLVTPEQINQALSVTSGHAVGNDRGYSLLENGVQHTHGFDLPMTQADRLALARQMALARQTTMKYPTLADAEKAGARRAGPFSPGLGTHMIMYADYAYAAGAGPMTDAQIEHPLAWIYDGTKPTSPVVGLFYTAAVENPGGFVGPNDVWHKHKNVCLTQAAGGGIDAPLGADRDATTAQCDAVGGHLLAASGPLLHVWAVPGYEDSQGVYAHLNPSITCQDGTYHVIDITKLGTRTSACVDGLE